LAALEDKVTTLGQEADRLCGIHADHADQIQAKRAEIVEYWESLTTKAKVHSFLCSLLTLLYALICITWITSIGSFSFSGTCPS
jgi:hypothetical protein